MNPLVRCAGTFEEDEGPPSESPPYAKAGGLPFEIENRFDSLAMNCLGEEDKLAASAGSDPCIT